MNATPTRRSIAHRIRRRAHLWWIDWRIAGLLRWEKALTEDGLAHPGSCTIELASLRSQRARVEAT